MTTRREWGGVLWVDAERPTPKEVRELVEEFSLSPIIGEELARHSWRPAAERLGSAVHLTLHFPPAPKHHGKNIDDEIDFVISDRLVLTVREGHNDALYRFGKEVEVASLRTNAHRDGAAERADGAMFFCALLRKLYESYFAAFEQNTAHLARIESEIFRGKEKEMVAPLSTVGRELLDAKRALSFHTSVLASFRRIAPALFHTSVETQLRSVFNDQARLAFIVDRNMDLLSELRETNTALLSTKQNEIMKVLTIMAFVTFPLSLIASIFGMNTEILPIVGAPNDFWIVIGIMATLTFIFFLFFKKNKWL